jgi:hypothetical protein
MAPPSPSFLKRPGPAFEKIPCFLQKSFLLHMLSSSLKKPTNHRFHLKIISIITELLQEYQNERGIE